MVKNEPQKFTGFKKKLSAKSNLKLRGGKMKIKWAGKTEFLVLTHGKVYDVISIEKDWYRIVDDSGEDYLYPPDKFEIVE